MTAPALGSRWIDTGARDAPPNVAGKATSDAPLRRIVEVLGTGSIQAIILGVWQQQIDGQWSDVATRRTYCDLSTFGRRYQPLEDQ